MFFERHGIEEMEFSYFNLNNFNFPLHFHRAFELIYIKSGEVSVTVDNQEYLAQKEDLVFVFPNQMHEFKTPDESQLVVILFSPEVVGDFYLNYKGLIPKNNVVHLSKELNTERWSSVYRQKSFLYHLCAELIDKTTFVPVQQSPQTKVLYKILMFVEKNYDKECTLKTVAKQLQYDYPYLSKLFVQMMNMTFTDYLNHYRISQAGYLLRNTHQPIGEVAFNCGYDNLRTFHRNFRKIMGQAPREYQEG